MGREADGAGGGWGEEGVRRGGWLACLSCLWVGGSPCGMAMREG